MTWNNKTLEVSSWATAGTTSVPATLFDDNSFHYLLDELEITFHFLATIRDGANPPVELATYSSKVTLGAYQFTDFRGNVTLKSTVDVENENFRGDHVFERALSLSSLFMNGAVSGEHGLESWPEYMTVRPHANGWAKVISKDQFGAPTDINEGAGTRVDTEFHLFKGKKK